MGSNKTYIAVATVEEIRLVPKEFLRNSVVIVTGVGPTNVIEKMDGLDRNADVVNFGFAGSPDIPKGTTVEIGSARLFHENADFKETVFRLSGTGAECRSSCDFVTKGRKGEVYDMELAFICALGFRSVRSFKTISDNCSYEEYEDTVKSMK